MTVHWDITQAPSLKGKVAVVTGATGGLGYATARGLVSRGAEVILAGRNPAKGAAALERLRTDCPDGAVDFMTLDLASLQSIADFTQNLSGRTGSVDILVNNAGVMGPPKRQETIDGFELQFGTNYLGPFALTARLRPLLCAGKGGRASSRSQALPRCRENWCSTTFRPGITTPRSAPTGRASLPT